MVEAIVGKVTHYFSRIGVAALNLDMPLKEGDRIHIVGPTTDLELTVQEMQVEHRRVHAAQPGDDIAIKVSGKVREGDAVFLRPVESP